MHALQWNSDDDDNPLEFMKNNGKLTLTSGTKPKYDKSGNTWRIFMEFDFVNDGYEHDMNVDINVNNYHVITTYKLKHIWKKGK